MRSYLIKILKYKEVPSTGNKGLLGTENAASVHCAIIHQACTLAMRASVWMLHFNGKADLKCMHSCTLEDKLGRKRDSSAT